MRAGYRIATWVAASLLLAGGGCEDKTAMPAGDLITVPSGQPVQLIDVITDTRGAKGATARFRFLAPDIAGGGIESEVAAADMQVLCDSYALPRIDGMVPAPQQIVITLSDEEVPFGETAPNATQFFEAYSIRDGHCIWEIF
jgi:hypothetical protein